MKQEFIQAIEAAIEELKFKNFFICNTTKFINSEELTQLIHTFKYMAKKYAPKFWCNEHSWWAFTSYDKEYVVREKGRFLKDLLIEVEKMSEEELLGRINRTETLKTKKL